MRRAHTLARNALSSPACRLQFTTSAVANESVFENLGGTLIVSNASWKDTVHKAVKEGTLSFGFSAGGPTKAMPRSRGWRLIDVGNTPSRSGRLLRRMAGQRPRVLSPHASKSPHLPPAGGCLFPYYIGVSGALRDGQILTGAQSRRAEGKAVSLLRLLGGYALPTRLAMSPWPPSLRAPRPVPHRAANTKVGGSSAGSLLAVCLTSGMRLDDITEFSLRLMADCRLHGTRGRLGEVLARTLHKHLPEDAHTKVQGKAYVSGNRKGA